MCTIFAAHVFIHITNLLLYLCIVSAHYICVCVYAYVYIYACVCMYVCMYVRMYVCMYMYHEPQ